MRIHELKKHVFGLRISLIYVFVLAVLIEQNIRTNKNEVRTMTENKRLYLTISSAHKQSSISKSIIHKAIKDGELAVKNVVSGKGSARAYQIDKADFALWEKDYRENRGRETSVLENEKNEQKRTNKNAHLNQLEQALKIKELEGELSLERKEKVWLESRLQKVEEEKDSWKEQASKLLLTYQPEVGQNQKGKIWGNVLVVVIIVMITIVSYMLFQVYEMRLK